MARRSLSRWHKASALVPMAVLVAAWGAALSSSGLASAADGVADAAAVPNVPGTAFDQPASVQEAPTGIDPRAGSSMAVSTLSANGIPAAALSAYRRAENLLSRADGSCNLPWHLIAAIGRVESNHGRTNNNTLSADGLAKPGIFGVPLDGKDGRARITDTDDGSLDKDRVLDRAVGPMQFIPGTWASVGVDADGDGSKNPQDIDDAATAAGVYLCAGPGDLSKRADSEAAVLRYNRSQAYVDLVLEISERYAAGDFSQQPNVYTTSPVLTNRASDQTLTPAQRKKASQEEKTFNNPPKDNGGGGTGTTGGTEGTGSTGGTGGTGTTGGGSVSTDSPGLVEGLVNGLTGAGSGGSGGGGSGSGGVVGGIVTDVTDTTAWILADTQCKLGPFLNGGRSYQVCMTAKGF